MQSNLSLFESTDWAATPLGPREAWPPDMQTVVRLALASGFPVSTVWGDDFIQIYNDGYNAIYGTKHPTAFACSARESWAEIWEFLAPALDQVRRDLTHLTFSNTLLPLAKRGVPEECYFDFSYSPIVDEDGNALGVMSIAVEKTQEVIYQRRQRTCDLPLDSMNEGGLTALAAATRSQFVDNTKDVAAAAFFSVDSRVEQPLEALWCLGMEEEAAAALRALPLAHPSGVKSHPRPHDLITQAEVADHLVSIPLRGSGGQLIAIVYIAPHPLVLADSHLQFAAMLSDRLHRIIHHAEQIGRVRREMADQDALYRYLFDNVMDGVLYASTDGGRNSEEFVLAANASACRLLGYPPEELVGMRRERLFFPDDNALGTALAVRAEQWSFDGELTFRRRDGSAVPVEVRSRLVNGADGEVRSVTILRDMSTRLQREAERARQARFEAIAQLTGGVAHDFNNLLTVVLGSLELLQEELPQGGRASQYTANALLCAERGANLTSQLLSYSRRQPLRLQPVDINAHLEEMLALIRSSIGEAMGLELVRAPDLPACMTDVTQLTTALLNLAVNARDAMLSGGTITIETALVLPGRDFVSVRVRDTGTGIPEELLGRVFEPYFTTKSIGSGSGLGLAMAQGFARQCGGDIRVQSELGEGSVFEITLPITHEAPASARVEVPAMMATGQSVLLVEDNDLVRAQVCEILAGGGFSVVEAASGREALELLARGPLPELLLTDLVMPGGWSGMQLAHEVRRLYPQMRVLIMTGHDPWTSARDDSDRCFEVLAKPFDRRTLLEAVHRQLEMAPAPP